MSPKVYIPKRRKQLSRSGAKTKLYREFMMGKCAHPDCQSGTEANAHHIHPLAQGGKDAYWNLICLCYDCHMHNHLHSRWEENDIELFTWKSMQELEQWGFTLDEEDGNFYDNYKILLLRNADKREFNGESKKIANNSAILIARINAIEEENEELKKQIELLEEFLGTFPSHANEWRA